MSDLSVTKSLVGSELESVERVFAMGRARKYRDDDFTSHGAGHHLKKSAGHMRGAGMKLDAIDDETGEPHLVLAICRLLMAAACVRLRGRK